MATRITPALVARAFVLYRRLGNLTHVARRLHVSATRLKAAMQAARPAEFAAICQSHKQSPPTKPTAVRSDPLVLVHHPVLRRLEDLTLEEVASLQATAVLMRREGLARVDRRTFVFKLWDE